MTQKHFETKQAEVSDTKLIETIETKLSKLCQTGGRSLSMSVPPQVSDIDMAICELIRRYKQLIITDVVLQSEQLKPKQQICYKSNEPCKYDCSGLCKESC